MSHLAKRAVRKALRSMKGGLPYNLFIRRKMDVRTANDKTRFIVEAMAKAKYFDLDSNADNIEALFGSVKINPDEARKFFYNIDVFKSYRPKGRIVLNSTLDWDFVVNHPLEDARLCSSEEDDAASLAFVRQNNRVLDVVITYLKRSIAYVRKSSFGNKDDIVLWLEGLETRAAQSFDEALQRILFVNELMWQTPHNLQGLGRLDLILDDVYTKSLQEGVITKEEAKNSIKEFLTVLHEYYWYKSGELAGDTGQIIILGGENPDGSYFSNDLTFLFIDAIRELQLPDPKALLRVSDGTPRELMGCALDCIKTGIGNPLFSNDRRIIPALIEFGYDEDDAYNYVTSACWEPLVPGVAHEQNNLADIHFLWPLFMMSDQDDLASYSSFDDYVAGFLRYLDVVCDYVCNDLDRIEWDQDPLLSLFTSTCREKKVDIAFGGGKYNNYGVLSLGISNLINSLMIVKRLVFDEKRFALQELDQCRRDNFEGHDEVLELLKNEDKLFGRSMADVIALTDTILAHVEGCFASYRNKLGGRIKFGLSSPSYITGCRYTEASFDGRKYAEPYSTHISADGVVSYTELMTFASKLDYSGSKFNGNVVDFFTTPSFIADNYEKFLTMIIVGLQIGVFQMQINVIDAATLIAAREHPEDYPNLIVRVWGFSAYYVDLPDEYKVVLIQRALRSEAVA